MGSTKSKQKLSILVVIIIFLVIYFGELGLGVGIFYYVVLPRVKDYQQQKIIQGFKEDEKAHPERAELDRLYEKLSPEIVKNVGDLDKSLNDKKYDEAINSVNLLQSKVKNDDEREFINLILVQAYVYKNDHEGIKKSAEALVKYGASYSFGYRYLTRAYLDEKNYKEALKNAQKAVELDPSQAINHFLLGIAFSWNNQFNESVSEIKKAVDLDPQNQEYKKELESQRKNAGLGTSNKTQIQTQTNKAQQLGSSYTKEDIDKLIKDLNQADQDSQTIINSYKGQSQFNQEVVNKVIDTIKRRKVLGQKLLDKMGKGQLLSQTDQSNWVEYNILTVEQDNLVKILYNGNGGF